MKKIVTILLVLTLSLTLFAGCQGGNYEVDKETLKLETENLTYEQEIISKLFGMPMIIKSDEDYSTWMENVVKRDDVEEFLAFYPAMNLRTDSMFVLKPKNGKTDVVKEGLETFIANQKKTFESYMPGNLPLLENADLYEEKGFVVCLISQDNETLKKVVTKHIGSLSGDAKLDNDALANEISAIETKETKTKPLFSFHKTLMTKEDYDKHLEKVFNFADVTDFFVHFPLLDRPDSAIFILKPAEGKESDVKKSLEDFLATMEDENGDPIKTGEIYEEKGHLILAASKDNAAVKKMVTDSFKKI